MKILIDNGHGQETAGKRSPDGRLLEWSYNREIARRVVTSLLSLGLDVELLVPEDDDISLAERCRRVTLIHRRDSFRAEQALVERAAQCPNLSILTETVITDLRAANGALDHILLKTADRREESLSISGLFVAFGRVPDTELAAALAERDKAGYLLTNERMETATPGFFAAGDCRQKTVRQLTTAVSDGTLAAIAACEWLAVQETEANNQNGRAHAAR